ncbi:hypothetical protein AB0J68_16380 [Micromonospora sp. NPDC049580]|uniref:hypothetical protein n=1 Tax=Micromonospora sp. NPDC049580 TaxID=3154832 RepID=UPI0034170BA4
MVGDGVLGIDRGVTHDGAEVEVADDLGGDLRRESGADGVGGEDPPESCGVKRIGKPVVSVRPLWVSPLSMALEMKLRLTVAFTP